LYTLFCWFVNRSVKSTERKEHEEQEKFLKGPGSFPLERLLAIFQCITAVANEELENLQSDNISAADENGLGPMADALMQLSTLCNINLLYKGTNCPLEGAARYRCNIDQELAMKVCLFLFMIYQCLVLLCCIENID
jgi:origin recognition complex subunit 5